ncbi:MAG: hypothetical protein RLZZ293_207 [Pseudomonadota bacterium]
MHLNWANMVEYNVFLASKSFKNDMINSALMLLYSLMNISIVSKLIAPFKCNLYCVFVVGNVLVSPFNIQPYDA